MQYLLSKEEYTKLVSDEAYAITKAVADERNRIKKHISDWIDKLPPDAKYVEYNIFSDYHLVKGSLQKLLGIIYNDLKEKTETKNQPSMEST